MKKFDVELAKQGKPVCNGYGMDVRILCYDLKDDKYPIVGATMDPETNREILQRYTLNGYILSDGPSNNGDLFMKGEKRKMWVNVYKTGPDGSKRMLGGLLSTTEEAVKEVIIDQEIYIATVPVEWEE